MAVSFFVILERENGAIIHLEQVTPENWRLGLKVKDEQRGFVSDSAGILARAWAYREHRSRAFVIYWEEIPVGMALYYDLDELQAYDFSQFYIDERVQGKGYGLEAARQILHMMKADGKLSKAMLCYVDGNTAAKHLYEKLGFCHTGESDGDEIIMERFL